MNKTIAFILGLAVGSVATYFVVKDHFKKESENVIECEAEELRRHYREKEKELFSPKELVSENEKNVDQTADIDKEEYCEKVKQLSYSRFYRSLPERETNTEEIPPEFASSDQTGPYCIPPEEFGADTRYDQIYLTYYSDNILADESDEVIEDIDEYIGWDNLNKFGEYESDVVHVRNDKYMTDYEITRDVRSYSYIVDGR